MKTGAKAAEPLTEPFGVDITGRNDSPRVNLQRPAKIPFYYERSAFIKIDAGHFTRDTLRKKKEKCPLSETCRLSSIIKEILSESFRSVDLLISEIFEFHYFVGNYEEFVGKWQPC